MYVVHMIFLYTYNCLIDNWIELYATYRCIYIYIYIEREITILTMLWMNNHNQFYTGTVDHCPRYVCWVYKLCDFGLKADRYALDGGIWPGDIPISHLSIKVFWCLIFLPSSTSHSGNARVSPISIDRSNKPQPCRDDSKFMKLHMSMYICIYIYIFIYIYMYMYIYMIIYVYMYIYIYLYIYIYMYIYIFICIDIYIYISLLITIWLGESTSIWIQLYQLWLRAVHDVRAGRSGRLGALPGGIFWHENLWGQWPKPKHSKTETRNMVFFPAYGKYGCSGGGQRMAKVLWQTQPEVGDATSKTTHLSKQTTVSKMKVLETTFLWVQKSKTQKQQMHNNRFEKQ